MMVPGQLFFSALQAIFQTNSSLIHSHAHGLPFPGLPVTSAPTSASYWAAHNRAASNHLIGYGKNGELPSHSDVVMWVCGLRALAINNAHLRFAHSIGAGISGATVAHFLIKSDNTHDSIVILEAREVSSGASMVSSYSKRDGHGCMTGL
jgi:hypothetical protein